MFPTQLAENPQPDDPVALLNAATDAAREIGEAAARGQADFGLLAIAGQQLLAVAQHTAAVTAAAADAANVASADGCRTTRVWLSDACRLAETDAATSLRIGRKLREMRHIDAALAAGHISRRHVDDLLGVWSTKTADAFMRDEEMLVGFARNDSYSEFRKHLRYWELCANPDGTFDEAESARRNRQFNFATVGERGYGSLITDKKTALDVNGVLEQVEKKMFADDWAEARERLGELATKADLRRTSAQRRHDAVVQLIMRGASAAPGATPPKPHCHIVMDLKTFNEQAMAFASGITPPRPDGTGSWFGKMRSETIDGDPIHPTVAFQMAMVGTINRAVFESPSCILDYGRSQRFMTGALRQALILRDQRCQGKGCKVPARNCEADHKKPWSQGGTTCEKNGQMLCDCENRAKENQADP